MKKMTRNEGRNTYLDHVEHGDKLQGHEHYMSLKKSFKALLEDHHLPTHVDELLCTNARSGYSGGRGRGGSMSRGGSVSVSRGSHRYNWSGHERCCSMLRCIVRP